MYEDFVAKKLQLSYSHIFPSHTRNVHITVTQSPPELPWANQISTAYELGDPTTMIHVGSLSSSRQNTLERPLGKLNQGETIRASASKVSELLARTKGQQRVAKADQAGRVNLFPGTTFLHINRASFHKYVQRDKVDQHNDIYY